MAATVATVAVLTTVEMLIYVVLMPSLHLSGLNQQQGQSHIKVPSYHYWDPLVREKQEPYFLQACIRSASFWGVTSAGIPCQKKAY